MADEAPEREEYVPSQEESDAAKSFYYGIAPMFDDLPTHYARKEVLVNLMKYVFVKESQKLRPGSGAQRTVFLDLYNDFAIDALHMAMAVTQTTCSCPNCILEQAARRALASMVDNNTPKEN